VRTPRRRPDDGAAIKDENKGPRPWMPVPTLRRWAASGRCGAGRQRLPTGAQEGRHAPSSGEAKGCSPAFCRVENGRDRRRDGGSPMGAVAASGRPKAKKRPLRQLVRPLTRTAARRGGKFQPRRGGNSTHARIPLIYRHLVAARRRSTWPAALSSRRLEPLFWPLTRWPAHRQGGSRGRLGARGLPRGLPFGGAVGRDRRRPPGGFFRANQNSGADKGRTCLRVGQT
jgi:hypothetical protein